MSTRQSARRAVAFAAALVLSALCPPAGTLRAADLSSLATGDSLEVHTSDGATRRGVLAPSADGTLVLATTDGLQRFSLDDVPRLRCRGRSTRKGAVIGALVGGAVFGIGAATILDDMGIGDDGGGDAGLIALSALVGAGGGLLAGGLVGAAFPAWHEIDPRRGRLNATGRSAATVPTARRGTGSLVLHTVP